MGEKMNTKDKQSLREIILFKCNKVSMFTILTTILLNITTALLCGVLNLPFWLDSIGTIITSLQFGPLAGAITAFISQSVILIVRTQPALYMLSGISVALIIGFLFPKRHREDLLAIITVGVLTALVTTLLRFPMDLIYKNGYTGNIWGDSLFRMLTQKLSYKGLNAYLASAFIDLPDRVLTVIIGLFLIDLEELRFLKSKNRSVTKTATDILVLILAVASLLSGLKTPSLRADNLDSDYDIVTYGSNEGILTSEINAVAQTNDGFIWVGTYAGLYKYCGTSFESAEIDEHIRNVMDLFVDRKGRLWIATNDSGAFCYDPSSGEVKRYSTIDGLSADSIRIINEDSKGNIYLGTVRHIARISPDGTVRSFKEWDDIYYPVSFADPGDGSMLGVTNTGVLFRIKDDTLMDTDVYEKSEGVSFLSVTCSDKEILAATTSDEIIRYSLAGDGLVRSGSFTVSGGSNISHIDYSALYNGYFYCAKDGFGFINGVSYATTDMTIKDFSGSVSDVCVDEQGNIWFSSTQFGLIKCSHSPFRNIMKRANLAGGTVNAVCRNGSFLYIGHDQGMAIIDTRSGASVDKPWLSELSGERVRNILLDSKGNLWVSTTGALGLAKVDPDGNIKSFTEQNCDMLGSTMRSAIELSDGRILAASNSGLTFFSEDKVVATIGEKQGLRNSVILSMFEREDGSILAASDGDGIYIIKDDKISGQIGAPQGLESLVVLRIVKGTEGYFYVTSNALYYDDGYRIRILENFPYTNNYDILVSDSGTCWIPSSAGLFLISEEHLIEDGDYTYTLLNKNWGLNTSFTANSWNLLTPETLFLCCTDSVRALSINEYSSRNIAYQIHLESVEVEDGHIYERDGIFEIPASNGRISFHVAVNNFTLTDPLIRYYLEGYEDSGITCLQHELQPLEYTNLGYGNYDLHVQILNEETGEVEREEIFPIRKLAMMYEKLYFRIYLSFIGTLMVLYIVWLFYSINKRTRKIRGLQTEMSTDPMTGLYNKAASERVLTKIVSEASGILLMIDLDSFKLVNDIYGHDMGDRILIRFAELIREAVGEGNMGGRIGGDEFIGFIKETSEESEVQRITRFLNREIVKSAKEFMGDDMNIPLGASIGAIRVPDEGRDYGDLFRNADKALYLVKQNGKHGYAFYSKGADTAGADSTDPDKNSLARIKKIIGERNEGKGAYQVNFDRFQVLYKYFTRDFRTSGAKSCFLRLSVESTDGSPVSDEARDALEEALITGLKKNDVISGYSGYFYILINDAGQKEAQELIEKIGSSFTAASGYEKLKIRTEADEIG